MYMLCNVHARANFHTLVYIPTLATFRHCQATVATATTLCLSCALNIVYILMYTRTFQDNVVYFVVVIVVNTAIIWLIGTIYIMKIKQILQQRAIY